jgi:hypothetical protein
MRSMRRPRPDLSTTQRVVTDHNTGALVDDYRVSLTGGGTLSVTLPSGVPDPGEVVNHLRELAASIARQIDPFDDEPSAREAILCAAEELRSHSRVIHLQQAQQLVAAYTEFGDIVFDYLTSLAPVGPAARSPRHD